MAMNQNKPAEEGISLEAPLNSTNPPSPHEGRSALFTPAISRPGKTNPEVLVRRAISIPKNAKINGRKLGSRLAESSVIYSHMSQDLKLPRVVKKNQRFQNNSATKYSKLRVKTDWAGIRNSQSPPPPHMAGMAFSVDLDGSGNYVAHFVGNGGESTARMVTPTRMGSQYRSTQTSRHLNQKSKRNERSMSAMTKEDLQIPSYPQTAKNQTFSSSFYSSAKSSMAVRQNAYMQNPYAQTLKDAAKSKGNIGRSTPESPPKKQQPGGDSHMNLVSSPPNSSMNTGGKKPPHYSMNEAELKKAVAGAVLFKDSRDRLPNQLSAQNINNIRKIIGKKNPYLESLLKKMSSNSNGIHLSSGPNLKIDTNRRQPSLSPSRVKSKTNYLSTESSSPRHVTRENQNLKNMVEKLFHQNSQLQKEVETLQAHNRKLEEDKRKLKLQVTAGQKKRQLFAEELEEIYECFSQSCFELSQTQLTREAVYGELVKSLGEKQSLQVNTDLEKSRFEMKIKLLQETLTKRNKEYETSEESNKQLLYLLERYDSKVSDLREEIDLKELKLQKYEQMNPEAQFDLESLEDRIKFLVELLQKYKAQLETLSEERRSHKKDAQDQQSNYSLESLQKAIKKHSVCSSPAGGAKYRRHFSSDLHTGIQGQEIDKGEEEGQKSETETQDQPLSDDEEVKLEQSEEEAPDQLSQDGESPAAYLQSDEQDSQPSRARSAGVQ